MRGSDEVVLFLLLSGSHFQFSLHAAGHMTVREEQGFNLILPPDVQRFKEFLLPDLVRLTEAPVAANK